jgi:hypothetical protein
MHQYMHTQILDHIHSVAALVWIDKKGRFRSGFFTGVDREACESAIQNACGLSVKNAKAVARVGCFQLSLL